MSQSAVVEVCPTGRTIEPAMFLGRACHRIGHARYTLLLTFCRLEEGLNAPKRMSHPPDGHSP